MNLSQYKQYFKDLAAGDADLQHGDDHKTFFMLTPDQATSILTSSGDNLIMLLTPYDKRPKQNSAESGVWMKQGFFMVVGKVKPEDYDHQVQIQEKCEEITDRFYKEMYYDRRTKLYGFDINTWDCSAFGPIVDNHYGYAVVFDIKDAIDLTRT